MTAVPEDKCLVLLFHFSADWPSYQHALKLILHADKASTKPLFPTYQTFPLFFIIYIFIFSFLIPLS